MPWHQSSRDLIPTVACRACGEWMDLHRREAHPTLGLPSELRTYDCLSCDRMVGAEVIQLGAVSAAAR